MILSFNVNSSLQRCIFEDASVAKYIIKRATDADFLDLLVFQTCNLVLIKELYQEVNNKPLEVYSRTSHDTEILRPNFVEGREPHSSDIFKYEGYNNWSTAKRKQFDLTRDKKDKRLGCRDDGKGSYWQKYDISTHKYEESICNCWKGMWSTVEGLMEVAKVEDHWCTINNKKVFRVPTGNAHYNYSLKAKHWEAGDYRIKYLYEKGVKLTYGVELAVAQDIFRTARVKESNKKRKGNQTLFTADECHEKYDSTVSLDDLDYS